MTYDLGGVAALNFTLTDITGAAANAAVCTVTVTQPDGTTVGPVPLTPVSTGVYVYYFVATQAGRHSYAFATSSGVPAPGLGIGGYSDVFNVRPAASTALISLADGKDLLKVSASNTTFDADIRQFIASITRWMNKFCGNIAPVQVTERVRAGGMFMMLRQPPVYQPAGQPYPLISMTPVLTYGLVYDLSLITVDFTNGEVRHKAGLPFIYGPYDLAYWSGRIITTENIELATGIMLKHLWAMERNKGRPAGYTPSAADDTTVLYGFAVPNRALEILDPDRAPAGIA